MIKADRIFHQLDLLLLCCSSEPSFKISGLDLRQMLHSLLFRPAPPFCFKQAESVFVLALREHRQRFDLCGRTDRKSWYGNRTGNHPDFPPAGRRIRQDCDRRHPFRNGIAVQWRTGAATGRSAAAIVPGRGDDNGLRVLTAEFGLCLSERNKAPPAQNVKKVTKS